MYLRGSPLPPGRRSLGDAGRHPAHPGLQQVADRGANQRAVPGMRTVSGITLWVAAIDLPDRHHPGLDRLHGARDDALQRGDDVRRHHDRVDAVMRLRGVRAAAGD